MDAMMAKGASFRTHVTSLIGTPDIVLEESALVVFVHGCYWHRHARCTEGKTIKSRTRAEVLRFNRQVARDSVVAATLEGEGWKVFIAWECDLKRNAFAVADQIIEIQEKMG